MVERRGLLVMAYGTPRGLDDVEAYYTDIRRGRPPTPELLAELIDRYRAIGGRSPLLDITRAQARGLERRLGVRAYVGQKHAAPFIADAVEAMARDGVEEAIGLVLAPHYSSVSVGDYEARARRASAQHDWAGRLGIISSWHVEPGFVAWLAQRVRAAIASLPAHARAAAPVVFTAHSLPERIVAEGDPYPEQLGETALAVAKQAELATWRVGWQSAGRTSEAWLGPDLLDIVRELAHEGAAGVVVCPCGFVADHLEVLYDVDIEARALADELGLELVRTESPNADPAFLDALADVLRSALEA